jgi:hypothetical protein
MPLVLDGPDIGDPIQQVALYSRFVDKTTFTRPRGRGP